MIASDSPVGGQMKAPGRAASYAAGLTIVRNEHCCPGTERRLLYCRCCRCQSLEIAAAARDGGGGGVPPSAAAVQ